ncbi:MAG: YihY/virulence factor BrkB family protein [Clostridiales bacterium]|jgi:membrane protein|nr:YihY/virulence factor BrkB family protein [Clostridiales bacterium]
MGRPILFLIRVGKEAVKDDLFALASQLTYKILLSFFPFILFLVSLLSFFNLDDKYWMQVVSTALPVQAASLLNVFMVEVVDKRSVGLLSISLLVSLYNASSGFQVVIRCINQTYGYKDCRNYLHHTMISVLLVFLFSLSLTFMLLLLIFNDAIFDYAQKYVPFTELADHLFDFIGLLITAGTMFLTTLLIYKLSNCKKTRLLSLMPGAVTAALAWMISSKVFNIYVNNFAKYSKVYGSIAGIFILIMWLNLISTFLLLGSEINSILRDSPQAETKVCA